MKLTILENIISIRKSLGLSQEYMASQLGMEQSNYGKIERGLVNLTYFQLQNISEILKLRLIDIVTYPDKYEKSNTISHFNDSKTSYDAICMMCKEKDKLIKSQDETIMALKMTIEILNKKK